MRDLAVVTWLWAAPESPFGPEYVNRLHSMLQRHLRAPHKLYCITDNPVTDFDSGIETVSMSPNFLRHADMRAGNRSCFRRLRIFDAGMALDFGPRILQLDLDAVIVDDVTPLFARTEPLVLCVQNRPARRTVYNPSAALFDAGVLHEMWERFDAAPRETWLEAKRRGWSCSDMAVINDFVSRLPVGDPRRPAAWTEAEGMVAYWRDVKKDGALPPGARMVLFYGNSNPGDASVQAKSPWVAEHWR